MEIEGVGIVPIRLAMRLPLETAHGVTRIREGALLCLRDRSGKRGFGEAMPLPGFGLESLPAAEAALIRAARALCREAPRDLAAARRIAWRCSRATPSARAALETALHDLAARRAGISLAALLGPPRAGRIEVNALLAAKTPREVRAAASAAVRAGFRTLKLKIGATTLDRDLARVEAAREAVGAEIALRLDANGGWDEPTAREALQRLADAAPEYVEQPVPAQALDALRRLRAHSPVPIAADEAAASPAAACALVRERAADVLILKPAVLGGPRVALALATRARRAGIDTIVTGFLDSAVGDAAALQLAVALGHTHRAAGLASQPLFCRDLAPAAPTLAGQRVLPGGPGLAVTPDARALAGAARGPARWFSGC